MSLQPLTFDGRLHLLDQRLLPHREVRVVCATAEQTADAIASMVVRGAPALALAAAYGYAMACRDGADPARAQAVLAAARPTAVNLRWALDRMAAEVAGGADPVAAASAIHDEDRALNRRLGDHGASLLTDSVLTICNTGALATGGWGTALGMVRSARAAGRDVAVWACETRPYDQGARLTTWECHHDEIPCTLIADSMAAAAMATGRVGSVVVGCDRVARNGDTANKIGTYGLAVLARHHGLPFYVAMPTSSYDAECPDGEAIPIEQRPAAELFDAMDVAVWNPAFDVTPAELVDAWVTEDGVRTSLP